ncbi:haloacid dehalogenase-like hydrolase [Kitasatospora camelliae]|uniref:phosphoserine phosphatase n=1 Tax=Kitasatospora camelliae TaxID=3156397 RepID=A0AAU8JNA2_9ACTN
MDDPRRQGRGRGAPAGQDWSTTSRYLTAPAAAALKSACGVGTPAGQPLTTSTNTACADEILAVYSDGTTTGGKAAFDGHDHRRMEPSYAWAAQVLAGYSAAEVKGFAAKARAENLAAPQGTTQTVGTRRVTGWVRYYDQQRDLIATLRRARFDVYVVSASPQPVVQVWAASLGIHADHVIGIRNKVKAGRFTPHLESCGGADDDSVITYVDGKRCFINQEILGAPPATAFNQQPAPKRQVFSAGDSDTDVTFVGDATALRLVLNRNKTELMCRSYRNSDTKWLVNPMFIEPKAAKASPYPCSTTGYVNGDGSTSPVLDTDGTVIPDQVDTVH